MRTGLPRRSLHLVVSCRAYKLRSTDENSWQQLMIALDTENRSADHLAEQLRGIESEIPDVVKLLQRSSEQQKQHRGEVREMLMRSDPFALSLA